MYLQINASSSEHTNSQQNATDTMNFQFPFSIPGTDLVALELKSYSGLSLEDGSKEGVSNVAAIILRNDGTKLLENARVELWQGTNKLNFELSYLPPGEKILVLDSNKRQYVQSEISACCGYETIASTDISGLVSIRPIGDKMLLISNPGPLPLKKLVVYFKSYDYESSMFLGGIVYEIPIYSLAPGETYFATPIYYSNESSRIVKIKTSG